MKEIYDALKDLGIEYTEYTHPPVYTCEDADKFYVGVPGGQSKSLFLRNKKGSQHYLVVLPARKMIDLKALSDAVEDPKLGFASPERLFKFLRTTPGSVSPFGLVFDIDKHVKVVVDEELMRSEFLHYHPNDNTRTIVIRSGDLRRFLEKYAGSVRYMEL